MLNLSSFLTAHQTITGTSIEKVNKVYNDDITEMNTDNFGNLMNAL
jgi:hypothetical protein